MMPRCEKPLCESALLKKKKTNKQTKHQAGLFPDRQQRERESHRGRAHRTQLVFTFATRQHQSALCTDPNYPSLTVLTNKPSVFFSLTLLFSFKQWDTHKLPDLGHAFLFKYIPCIHVKSEDMCEQKRKTRFEQKIKKWGLKRIGVYQCKWTLYKVKERGREDGREVKRNKGGGAMTYPDINKWGSPLSCFIYPVSMMC